MSRARSVMIGLLLAIAAGPVCSQPGQPSNAPTITVHLSNFAFNPDQLLLRVGVPVRLHLVNDSSGGHNFSAPDFFAASTFPSGSAPPGGKVDVTAGGSADVVVVPRAVGTYKFECTHFLHALFGMTGRIIVQAQSG